MKDKPGGNLSDHCKQQPGLTRPLRQPEPENETCIP
jgi:hypothetical protein